MMQQRLILTALMIGLALAGRVSAQTLRFQTTVGSFDMVLNPDNDPNLQPLVDNIVAYVGLGRYHFSAINRAADATASDPSDDFVLQMGGFLAFPPATSQWTDYLTEVEALPAVEVDADGDGQVDFNAATNGRGTVSLALSAGNPNSGRSSFFINLGDNAFLDSQGFVPFAEIADMSTIDRILALEQVDLSNAAGSPGNLAFIDVPTVNGNRLVVVTDVTVVASDPGFSFVGPIATALQLAQRENGGATNVASSQALTANGNTTLTSGGVPEPTTALLAGAAAGLFCMRRRIVNGR